MLRVLPFLLCIAITLPLVSCDSGTTPTDASVKKGNLLISPSEFQGVQFETYSFKAKVEGYPRSDVKFYWDFGDGSYLLDNRQDVTNRFLRADTFYIKVKAVEAFTDAVLDIDSIKASVTRPDRAVVISPKDLDTVISEVIPLTYKLRVDMNVSSAYDQSDSYVNWYINDTLVTKVSHWFNAALDFPSEGIYEVKAEVFDQTGYFVGSDSTTINLHLPSVSMNDIISAKNISAFLTVDKTSSVPGVDFLNPIAFGTQLSNDQYRTVTVIGNTLDVSHTVDTGAANRKAFRNNSLSCIFSDDVKRITDFQISVEDTSFDVGKAKFSFSVKNVTLVSVTSSEIIFTATAPTTAILAGDLQCKTDSRYKNKTGSYVEIGSHIEISSPKYIDYSQIVIVFTR